MIDPSWTVQDYGYMLVTLGTFGVVGVLFLSLTYFIWLFIPVRAESPVEAPQLRRPVKTLPPARMAPQRRSYAPRHGIQKAPVPAPARPAPPTGSLPVPADPWLPYAQTEIR